MRDYSKLDAVELQTDENQAVLNNALKAYFFSIIHEEVFHKHGGNFTGKRTIKKTIDDNKGNAILRTIAERFTLPTEDNPTENVYNLKFVAEEIARIYNQDASADFFEYLQVVLVQTFPDISDEERIKQLDRVVRDNLFHSFDFKKTNNNIKAASVENHDEVVLVNTKVLADTDKQFSEIFDYTDYLTVPGSSFTSFDFHDCTYFTSREDAFRYRGPHIYACNDSFLYNFNIVSREKIFEIFDQIFPKDMLKFVNETYGKFMTYQIDDEKAKDAPYGYTKEQAKNIIDKYRKFIDKVAAVIIKLQEEVGVIYDKELSKKYKDEFKTLLLEEYHNNISQIPNLKFNHDGILKIVKLEDILANHYITAYKQYIEYGKNLYKVYTNLPYNLNNLFEAAERNEEIKDMTDEIVINENKTNLSSYKCPFLFEKPNKYFNSYNINYVKELNEFYMKTTGEKDNLYFINRLNEQFRRLFETLSLFKCNTKTKFFSTLKSCEIEKEQSKNINIVKVKNELPYKDTKLFNKLNSAIYVDTCSQYMEFIIAVIDYLYYQNMDENQIGETVLNYMKSSKFFEIKDFNEAMYVTETSANKNNVSDRMFQFMELFSMHVRREEMIQIIQQGIIIMVNDLDKKNPVFSLFYNIFSNFLSDFIGNTTKENKKYIIKNFMIKKEEVNENGLADCQKNKTTLGFLEESFAKLIMENTQEIDPEFKTLYVEETILNTTNKK